MQIPFVDLKTQYESIKPEIDAAIAEVIAETAFIGGAHVRDFEKAFSGFCGASHCVGVGNGTDALFLALKALGIGKGDEVIVPANSFVATSEAVTMAGARVVFADIDPATYNLDTDDLASKINTHTRAVIAVHLYGRPADMDPISAIAKENGLFVLEDAAQAHGATYKGRVVGTLGDIACFSFYPGKNLGAYGDGGALVTQNEEWATKARMLANHGRVDKYDHEVEGVNSRLDGLQAAILTAKLKHLPAWTKARQRNAAHYEKHLQDSTVRTPSVTDPFVSAFHLYVVRVEANQREALRNQLASVDVSTGIHYPIALPNLAAYRYLGHDESDFPHATLASREILSLPMYPEITEETIESIANHIKTFLACDHVRS